MSAPQKRPRSRRPLPLAAPVSSTWFVSRNNPKLGPGIPAQLVGETREELRASCLGCSLAPWEPAEGGGGSCYFHVGNGARAAGQVFKAVARGSTRGRGTLAEALAASPRSARFARFGAGGEPTQLRRELLLGELEQVKREGLAVVGYVHGAMREPQGGLLRREFLASAETEGQAVELLDRGWNVALAGPESAERLGLRRCPQADKPWVTCNACLLCDQERLRRTRWRGIVFPAHGGGGGRLPLAGVAELRAGLRD